MGLLIEDVTTPKDLCPCYQNPPQTMPPNDVQHEITKATWPDSILFLF